MLESSKGEKLIVVKYYVIEVGWNGKEIIINVKFLYKNCDLRSAWHDKISSRKNE